MSAHRPPDPTPPELPPTEVAMSEAAAATAETIAPPVEPTVTPPAEAAAATATAETATPQAAETATATTTAGTAVTDAKPRRRLAMPLAVAWALRAIIGTALFVGGIAIGYAWFQSQQVQMPAVIADPATTGVGTPPVVQEFVAALASNDSDALRSAVTGDPYRLLAGELQKWGFQEVTSVETLATTVDGDRSATAVVLRGVDDAAAPIIINLIVHTEGNAITDFR
jgi:hypothetical protein